MEIAKEKLTKEQQEILSKAQVHICIPCYGGMLTEAVFSSMLRFQLMAAEYDLRYAISTITNESLIPRGRNNLVGLMMANNNSTHLLFIDADIQFKPEDIIKLILRDKDIIGGPVPKKAHPVKYALNKLPNPLIEKELLELQHLGTAFLMIKRGVLEKLFEAHPNEKYNDDLNFEINIAPYLYNLFSVYVDEGGNYLSEDWAFCVRARKLAYRIWCDRSIELNHSGYHTFSGNTQELY